MPSWEVATLLRYFIERTVSENGTRTRDPNLGKVMLYQLSYFRLFFKRAANLDLFFISAKKTSLFSQKSCCLLSSVRFTGR
jgi:hypothetical protein